MKLRTVILQVQIWGSYFNIPKAIFYLLKEDHRFRVLGCMVLGSIDVGRRMCHVGIPVKGQRPKLQLVNDPRSLILTLLDTPEFQQCTYLGHSHNY